MAATVSEDGRVEIEFWIVWDWHNVAIVTEKPGTGQGWIKSDGPFVATAQIRKELLA